MTTHEPNGRGHILQPLTTSDTRPQERVDDLIMANNRRDIHPTISSHRPDLEPYEDLYRHLHANPELSLCESETAKLIVARLTDRYGDDMDVKYPIGGHGIAAILRNGVGPTVLLRADTDALPVFEKTGLPYASTKRMADATGVEQPVMHACGHDMHMTSLLAATELLHGARAEWSGTLVLVFQPAEEKGKGAQAMIDDGLYTRHGVPVPDVVLGGHVMPGRAGTLGTRAGAMASSADSWRVTLHGRGAHASQPHAACDPVVMAAHTIVRLQTIVSREINPQAPAVVTVAAVRAGEAENVIPESAELKIDMRAFDAAGRRRLVDAVRRIVHAESVASGAPREPEFEELRTFPILVNDDDVTARLSKSMGAYFGDAFGVSPHLGGSEDFGILATSVDRPSCFWVYGGVDPELYERKAAEETLNDLPINHSAYFAPVIQPTLTTATDAYALAALTWLGK